MPVEHAKPHTVEELEAKLEVAEVTIARQKAAKGSRSLAIPAGYALVEFVSSKDGLTYTAVVKEKTAEIYRQKLDRVKTRLSQRKMRVAKVGKSI